MTGIGRRFVLVLTIGCFQSRALLAQSPEIGHDPLAGAEVGTNGLVSASAVFDDGHGPALYVGGHADDHANRLAKWDGTRWTPLAGEIEGHAVFALAVFDDGSGPALYVGGNFTSVGALPVSNIVKWDGKNWSALGHGTNWLVFALTLFDDGSGTALYAAGDFTTAGHVRAENIAKWNGRRWSALGFGANGKVNGMTVFDDGNGPALYVAGFFSVAGDAISNRITKWDGKSWSEIGGVQGVNGTVYAVAVSDDGQAPALYIGGDFLTFLNQPFASRVAKWDGKNWSALASGVNGRVQTLAGFDDGNGPALFAGGQFSVAGDVRTNNIARWDGNSWSAVGSAPGRKF